MLNCKVLLHYGLYQEGGLQVSQRQNPHQCQSEVHLKAGGAICDRLITCIRRVCSGPAVLFWSQETVGIREETQSERGRVEFEMKAWFVLCDTLTFSKRFLVASVASDVAK